MRMTRAQTSFSNRIFRILWMFDLQDYQLFPVICVKWHPSLFFTRESTQKCQNCQLASILTIISLFHFNHTATIAATTRILATTRFLPHITAAIHRSTQCQSWFSVCESSLSWPTSITATNHTEQRWTKSSAPVYTIAAASITTASRQCRSI